jgi:hypothetical protein
MRFLLPLLLLAPPGQDEDLRKRVRALVEALQSDEIQAVDEALAGLIALGPPALGPIQEETRKASGDAKLRLGEVARKIERNAKRGRALGPPVQVTIDAKGRLLGEVLEEIRTSTGQPIVGKDLPADRITLKLDQVGFWEALDRLCKSHGGVMWEVEESSILVFRRPYRELPKVIRGNQVVFFRRLTSEHQHQGARSQPSLTLDGAVAWTKGSGVPREELVIDEFVDDQGTNLAAGAQAGGGDTSFSQEEASDPAHLVRALSFSESTTLSDKAESLARLKGRVRLEYVLDSKRLALLEKPASLVNRPQKAGGLTLTISKYAKRDEGAQISLTVESKKLPDKLRLRPSGFRLIDSKGGLHPASGWVDEADEDALKVTFDCTLQYRFPEGTEIAAFEFTVPTDVEAVSIPFDFKGLPLK